MDEHLVPQAPQLALLVLVSTHTPPQSLRPVGQEQEPLEQIFPPEHLVPQAPQLLESLLVLTQAPPHTVWPEGQEILQVPLEHNSPDLQTFPQPPQLLRSVFVFTQMPLQSVPVRQRQEPKTHCFPPVQEIPH